MRRTLIASRAGLTAAAAFVLLTACGGSSGNSNDAASTSTSETTTSSAENSAPKADSEFCTQAQALTSALENAFTGNEVDPTAVAQQFQQTADAIRSLDPPAEIADDWEKIAAGLETISQVYANYKPGDPASQSSLAQAAGQLQTDLGPAGAHVSTYLTEQCGIDTGDTTESATPTS